MATSLVLSLDTRRQRQDGTYPIVFRLTHNTKTTAIGSGFWVHMKDWDVKKRLIRSSYKGTENPKRLNNLLVKRKASMMDMLNRLSDRNELKFLTLTQVKDRLAPSHRSETLFVFMGTLIEDLVKANRIGTARSYRCVLGVMRSFCRERDISLNAINVDFLRRFEIWHLSKPGNSVNGLAVYLRTLRAVLNKAITQGLIEREAYPFHAYTIRTAKTRKRAITLDAIRKLIEVALPDASPLEYYRQVFLMSFYLQGMPFADMARLKVENIVDGRIKYDRQKTDRPYDVRITPQLEVILKTFTIGKERSDYLLPVIKRTNPIHQYKDILWAIQRYNKNLKKLAQLAGIEENLTSYVARHSFASLADEMEIPVTGIRDMLGHERVSTTESYLSDLRKSKIDEYQSRVLDNL
jgi:integrase/recombinase XerD